MSENSAKYQRQVSGAPVETRGAVEYKIGDVEFDGFVDGKLVEAKAQYTTFINSNGHLQQWIVDKFLTEARRQLPVAKANNLPLEWHFQAADVADLVRALFRNADLDIVVRHVP